MAIKDELKGLIGKKCWFAEHNLEIRKSSDAEIISVDDDRLVLKHFLGQVHQIPISEIWTIRRKD